MIWQKLISLFSGSDPVETPVFQPEWLEPILTHVPLVARLPEDLRLQLQERIAWFIATTRFQGCRGLELTEDMILTVAAQACLLVLHREGRP